MTNPFDNITDPAVIYEMVQEGVTCERCDGRGWHDHWADPVALWAMDELGHKDCPTCSGTGKVSP